MGRLHLVKLSEREYQMLETVKKLLTMCGTFSFSEEAKKIVEANGARGCYIHLGCQLVIEHLRSRYPEEVKTCLG